MPSTSPSTSTEAPNTSATGSSGSSSGAMKLSEQDVRKKVESEGYTNVSDIKQDRNGYTAKAMKGGKEVTLDVDNTGKVEAHK
jgi:hypothetical protein